MLVIKPKKAADWMHAMFILSYYKELTLELFSNGEDAVSTYMVVEGEEDSLRLAEMAFQMNWHQGGWICPHCEGDEEETCGHLTFTHPINPAF